MDFRKKKTRYWNETLLKDNRKDITNVQGWSDGGSRDVQNISSYGWVLKAWCRDEGPFLLAAGACFLDRAAASSFEVEAMGMQSLCTDLRRILGNTWHIIFNGDRNSNNLGHKRRRTTIDGKLFRQANNLA